MDEWADSVGEASFQKAVSRHNTNRALWSLEERGLVKFECMHYRRTLPSKFDNYKSSVCSMTDAGRGVVPAAVRGSRLSVHYDVR